MSNNEISTLTPNMPIQSNKGYKGFQQGNKFGKGRPQGSRSHAQIAIDAIGAENAQAIFQMIIDRALQGDLEAGRYVLDKMMPNAKGRYVRVDLPSIDTIDNVAKAQGMITKQVAKGNITTEEAEKLSTIIEHRRKTIELSEAMHRMSELEKKVEAMGL